MKKNLISLVVLIFTFSYTAIAQKYVLISTEYGDMKVLLYDETPLHQENFIKLAKDGFFDGTLFHRVIKEFMIQGGDPESKTAQAGAPLGSGGPGYTVPAEFKANLFHKKGALSAARMGDQMNPMKASSGSQFYVVQGKVYNDAQLNMLEGRLGFKLSDEQRKAYKTIGGTPFLDRNYTVFGEIVDGLDVIDKIAAVATDGSDRPKKDIKMTVKVVK
ncbi:MAG: peptidylprolyl isomerase [Bacteroidales bacterium]|nr:peptidylprolyl isomerase [Bacteroidales bacterium]